MKKILFIAAALIFAATLSFGQKTITGKVTDKNTAKFIAGADVFVKEKPSVLTKSGNDGTFSLNVPTEGLTIVVQAAGYKKLEMPIGNKTTLTLPLIALPPKNETNSGSH